MGSSSPSSSTCASSIVRAESADSRCSTVRTSDTPSSQRSAVHRGWGVRTRQSAAARARRSVRVKATPCPAGAGETTAAVLRPVCSPGPHRVKLWASVARRRGRSGDTRPHSPDGRGKSL